MSERIHQQEGEEEILAMEASDMMVIQTKTPESQVLQCPRCHLLSGAIITEQSGVERGELPEGLVGVSVAQCSNPVCLHEWELVTHGQILRSMSMWPASGPGGGVRGW